MPGWNRIAALGLGLFAVGLLAADDGLRCPACGNDVACENTPEGAFLKMRTAYLTLDPKRFAEAVAGLRVQGGAIFRTAPSEEFGVMLLGKPKSSKLEGDRATITLELIGGGGMTAQAVNEGGTWKVALPPGTFTEANERVAEAMLMQLASTQGVWRQTDSDRNGVQDYWTQDVAGFYFQKDVNDVPLKYIDVNMALADHAGVVLYEREEGPKPKSGYWLRVIPLDAEGSPYSQDADGDGRSDTNDSCFAFCAYPAEYGVTGLHTFIVNEEGLVYFKDLGPDAKEGADRWPAADPTAAGWGISE